MRRLALVSQPSLPTGRVAMMNRPPTSLISALARSLKSFSSERVGGSLIIKKASNTFACCHCLSAFARTASRSLVLVTPGGEESQRLSMGCTPVTVFGDWACAGATSASAMKRLKVKHFIIRHHSGSGVRPAGSVATDEVVFRAAFSTGFNGLESSRKNCPEHNQIGRAHD